MAITMKMDGDAEKGWMGEVHDGEALTAHSPQGDTVWQALVNMVHTHFGIHDEPAADDLPVEDIKTAEAPQFHKLPAADLKDLLAQHDEPYVNKQQAAEFLQAKASAEDPANS